jgi:hypothetical protein
MRLQKPPWKKKYVCYSWTIAICERKLQAPFCETRACSAWVIGPYGVNRSAFSFELMLALILQFLRIKNEWTWTWTIGRLAQWLWPCTRHFQRAARPYLSGTLNGLGGWSAHQVPNAKFMAWLDLRVWSSMIRQIDQVKYALIKYHMVWSKTALLRDAG